MSRRSSKARARGRRARTPARTCLLAGVLAGIGASGAARADTGIDVVVTDLPADDLAVVARGETVYAEACAACHGVELEGQPDWRRRDANGLLPAPPHDASGHTWHHADDLLFEIVKYGPGAVIGDPEYRSAMPAYDGLLSDEDIVAALSYIKHSWPEKERAWQREVDAPAESADEDPGTLLERLFR